MPWNNEHLLSTQYMIVVTVPERYMYDKFNLKKDKHNFCCNLIDEETQVPKQ